MEMLHVTSEGSELTKIVVTTVPMNYSTKSGTRQTITYLTVPSLQESNEDDDGVQGASASPRTKEVTQEVVTLSLH